MPSDPFAGPVTLDGRFVRLIPLAREHSAGLVGAAWDPEVSRYLRWPLPARVDEMEQLVQHRLALAESGRFLPFSTTLRSSSRIVGTTNFCRPDRPNQTVEIGGTWLDSRFWRTPVNTEAKFLMLRYAFELAGQHRVYFQTDLRNARSQKAIARLGTVRETTFREDVHLGEGAYRTSVYYSMLAGEWPSARAHLEALLERPWSPPTDPDRGPAAPGSTGPYRPFRIDPPWANPDCFRRPPTLVGSHVTLVPLALEQVPGLTFAGRDPEVWRYLRIGPGLDRESMAELVSSLLAGRDRGEVQPFAILSRSEGRPVGIVRYLDIDHQNSQVELGTWIDSTLWRTPVNTEVKYLALRHAFETEGLHRVQLRTDSRNVRSQRAIERLGALREGTLREYILRPGGYRRSSVCYSILAAEWPGVRGRLEDLLARPWTRPEPTNPGASNPSA